MKTNPEHILTDLRVPGISVGNDLVFLPDFEKSFNELFRKKVYTDKEVAYCEMFDNSLLRFASTWAAKESVHKAVKQLKKGPLPFKKIEILRSKPGGMPQVTLPDSHAGLEPSLSISHDGDYVWAVAIIRKDD